MQFKSDKRIHGCIHAKRHKTASETLLRCCLGRRGLFRFFPGLTIFITSRPIRTTNGTKVTSRITIPVYFAPFASVTFVARPTGLTSANIKHLWGNVLQITNLYIIDVTNTNSKTNRFDSKLQDHRTRNPLTTNTKIKNKLPEIDTNDLINRQQQIIST